MKYLGSDICNPQQYIMHVDVSHSIAHEGRCNKPIFQSLLYGQPFPHALYSPLPFTKLCDSVRFAPRKISPLFKSTPRADLFHIKGNELKAPQSSIHSAHKRRIHAAAQRSLFTPWQ